MRPVVDHRAVKMEFEGLSAPMREMLTELLLYKSVFTSAWFHELATWQEESADARAFARIAGETMQEALAVLARAHEWDRMGGGVGVERAAGVARRRIIEDLLALKEGSTEACLGVAMQAPTEELRRAFIALADVDRVHADDLRRLLGARGVEETLRREASRREGQVVGAHEGRLRGGSLRESVEGALSRLRARQAEPMRLVLSPMALRHLRDEGALDDGRGTALGLPVEVDFGWDGECFAVATRERVGLAEIITATHAEGGG